jgi:hypothetical protein
MAGQLVPDLIGRAREEVSARAGRNRFADLLEAGRVPRERLTWLAGEQFRIISSDQRSFALLAAPRSGNGNGSTGLPPARSLPATSTATARRM